MYDKTRFANAKISLRDSALFCAGNLSLREKAETEFMYQIMSRLATNGRLTHKDVDYAFRAAYEFMESLSDDCRDEIIFDLQEIGDYYIGSLSPAQHSEFRQLYNLCWRCINSGSEAASEIMSQIEEIVYG